VDEADIRMIITSRRLDERESPQREMAPKKKKADTTSAAHRNTRLANKPKCRP
jgi:hypothetical protein